MSNHWFSTWLLLDDTLYNSVGNMSIIMLNSSCFILDRLPPVSEVINGDTKIVTEFKRNDDGKLLKVISVLYVGLF